MSSTTDFPFSVEQQELVISADYNATLVFIFLFGIYTGVFGATIYIYISRESRTFSNGRVVMGCMIALYATTAVNVPINWFYTSFLLCTKGGTRVEMFIESATEQIPKGLAVLTDITGVFSFILADGLMVWRCFYACGRSLRRSLFPLCLFMGETVLVISSTTYKSLLDVNPESDTVKRDRIEDRLNASMLLSVALTSLVATFMICRQIYTLTTRVSGSRKRYRSVLDALVQSSGIYSFFILFLAIVEFAEAGVFESTLKLNIVSEYIESITLAVTGLAPTVMIARLFLSSTKDDFDMPSANLPSDLLPRQVASTLSVVDNQRVDV
ncbi:hypothetical protein D9613_012737 [Agrocybe pediades]|uniref:Uncharacterized protein n=1 Tax=Agrocybe pediades TaxID=84607 RepID=A0A8H4QKJ2_9AGAR|nr:hypothetical protein D9613_012737 [Agrocybe pediades]